MKELQQKSERANTPMFKEWVEEKGTENILKGKGHRGKTESDKENEIIRRL